jgi:hypothetical protein
MRKTSDQKVYDARRQVLPGYPIETPFESLKEVREYLKGSKIVCLLCGKAYKKLNTHLNKIHKMAVDDYRGLYRIPWTYGLLSPESKDNHHRVAARMLASGWHPPVGQGVQAEGVAKVIYKVRRPCPFRTEISLENLGELCEKK